MKCRSRCLTALAMAALPIRATVRSTTDVNSSITKSPLDSAIARAIVTRNCSPLDSTRNGRSHDGGSENPTLFRSATMSLMLMRSGNASRTPRVLLAHVEQPHRHHRHAEALRGAEPRMPGDQHLVGSAGHERSPEPEALDRGRHLRDRRVRDDARVALARPELLDRKPYRRITVFLRRLRSCRAHGITSGSTRISPCSWTA